MGSKPRVFSQRSVAFLRGMNLGKRRITNDELSQAFTQLGFHDITVYQASGNVIFEASDSDGLEDHIATGLKQALGYDVPTFVRTVRDVHELVATQPFDDMSQGKPQVIFLATQLTKAAARKVATLTPPGEQFRPANRALYWLPNGGISTTELDFQALERVVGPMTIRTLGTVQRIAAKLL